MLGLEKRVDLPFGDGHRWIEIAAPAAETPIVISPPGPTTTPGGKDTGISLATDDIDALQAHLREQGADADAEITRFDFAPLLFWFRDPEGNTLMAVPGLMSGITVLTPSERPPAEGVQRGCEIRDDPAPVGPSEGLTPNGRA